MLIKKKIRKQVEVVTGVLCNRCKCSCLRDGEMYGLSAVVSGGYNSTYLEDMVMYCFELCEKCLLELFTEFKIQPDKELPYFSDEGGIKMVRDGAKKS
jgi:hypothetical protein